MSLFSGEAHPLLNLSVLTKVLIIKQKISKNLMYHSFGFVMSDMISVLQALFWFTLQMKTWNILGRAKIGRDSILKESVVWNIFLENTKRHLSLKSELDLVYLPLYLLSKVNLSWYEIILTVKNYTRTICYFWLVRQFDIVCMFFLQRFWKFQISRYPHKMLLKV